jgi:hypothetical protein
MNRRAKEKEMKNEPTEERRSKTMISFFRVEVQSEECPRTRSPLFLLTMKLTSSAAGPPGTLETRRLMGNTWPFCSGTS